MIYRITHNDSKIEIRNNAHSINILYNINKIREELEEVDFLNLEESKKVNDYLDALESILTR